MATGQSVFDIILNIIQKGDGARKAAEELKDVSESSKDAEKSTSLLTKASGLLQTGMAALAGVIVKNIGVAIELGDQYNRSVLALEGYAGGAMEAAQAISAVEEAGGGMIDRLTATQNATRLFAMGLATTAEEAANLTNIATTLGAAVGKDAKGAFEDFSLMLANTSIMRLDTFGISAAAVKERMAEMMEAEEGLDRQTAFLNATMEIANDQMAKLEESGFSAVTGVGKLRTEFTNLLTLLGSAVAPIVDRVADALSGLVGQLVNSIDAEAKLKQAFEDGYITQEELNTAITQATYTTLTYDEVLEQLDRRIKQVDAAKGKSAEASGDLQAAEEDLILTEAELALQQEELQKQLEDLHTLMNASIADDLEDTQERYRDLVDELGDYLLRIDELERKSYLTEDQAEELVEAKIKVGEIQDKIEDVTEAWEDQTKRMIFGLAEQRLAIDGFTSEELDALAKLAGPEGLGLIDDLAVAMIGAIGDASDELDDGKISADQYADKIMDVSREVGNLESSTYDMIDALNAIPTEIDISVTMTTEEYMAANPPNLDYTPFDQGGNITVSGPPGPGAIPVTIFAQNDEKISVTPAAMDAPRDSSRGDINVTINNDTDLSQFLNFIQEM